MTEHTPGILFGRARFSSTPPRVASPHRVRRFNCIIALLWAERRTRAARERAPCVVSRRKSAIHAAC